MKDKNSSALNKIIPIILCVLLFACFIPPAFFADDLSIAGGSTRGGGVGRLHDALTAADESALRTGDLICNSCGSAYSSDTALPVDFKCPSCGDYFFSVTKVTLTCWNCKKTSVFNIDDITSYTNCPYCGSYISSLVNQNGKTGYAFKAGGGSTRGGGVGRKHTSAPSVDSSDTFTDIPDNENDFESRPYGHGMIKMNHAFSSYVLHYATTQGKTAYSFVSNVSCSHFQPDSDIFKYYLKSHNILDGEYGFKTITYENYGNDYDPYFPTEFACEDDYISCVSYPQAHNYSSVFYCIAPESGYYWVSHYPLTKSSNYYGLPSHKEYKDSNGNIKFQDPYWISKSDTPVIKYLTQPLTYTPFSSADFDTKISFPCSNSVGYSNLLSKYDPSTDTYDEYSTYGLGQFIDSGDSSYLTSPMYCEKGSYIFFDATLYGGPHGYVDNNGYKSINKLEYPYLSYIASSYGVDDGLVYYDWKYDDDDDTYIVISYPDPVSYEIYTPVSTFTLPENSTSSGNDGEENGHCDHSGIIKAIHEFNYSFNNWKNTTLPTQLNNFLLSLKSFQEKWFNKIIETISSTSNSVNQTLQSVSTSISSAINNLYNSFTEFWTPKIALISNSIDAFKTSVENYFEKIMSDYKPYTGISHHDIIPVMDSSSYSDAYGVWKVTNSSFTYAYRAFSDSGYTYTNNGTVMADITIEIPNPDNFYIDGFFLQFPGGRTFMRYCRLQSSDDGSNWNTLYDFSDIDEYQYTFSSDLKLHKCSKYYRLYFYAPNMGSYDCFAIKRFQLLGYSASEVIDNSKNNNNVIVALLTDIRDKLVSGFSSISADIVAAINDFKTSVTANFNEIAANFTLAIDNLNDNIKNIINKKLPDLPEESPSPTPSPSPSPFEPSPIPSPSPDLPLQPILPDSQKYIVPTMDANSFTDSHGTWIASASSFNWSKYAAYNAFRPDGFWVNGQGNQAGPHNREMPCWIQIQIPDPENYYVDGYIIQCGPSDNFDVWQVLGSEDGETWSTLDSVDDVSLADDDIHQFSVPFHKAYKYYRLYIEHFSDYMGVKQFNLLGYDADKVIFSTPTPDPGENPTPTPAPTENPDSGDDSGGDKTNNFWNIIFPNGGDNSEDEHKGIFWALVSLILALIAFFTNLFAGVSYLFPFLPDGVVTTINTCLFVVFLFVIIKFIMRSK